MSPRIRSPRLNEDGGAGMTGWAKKRFWKEATVAETSGGLSVLLDGRPIMTPSRQLLALPSAGLAQAIADEWAQQEDLLRPATMPMTRFANTALDRVAPEFEAVAEIVTAYGETDLLCYRAHGPDELVRRQAAAWDPVLDWACSRYGARLVCTQGVVPVDQAPEALARLGREVRGVSSWQLTALHELVSLTGSLLLGLAILERAKGPEEAWALSRIDEEWQFAQWGRDAEADAAAERRRAEFEEAARFLRMLDALG
jgi:chaperone required for assembly of F1-ATPase